MDRPSDSQQPSKPTRPEPKHADAPWKVPYLSLYNVASAFGWFLILLRVLLNVLIDGPASVHPTNHYLVKLVQSAAGLEILHSLLGVVRAPLLTTVMQVASRFLLVWGVVEFFPQLAVDEEFGGAKAYISMLVAWSVTEVVRYAYFALSVSSDVPGFIKWLRYNTFFVLYPLGIGSECFLVYLAATGPAKYVSLQGFRVSWALWAVLAVYVPGSYILFTHMMAQRKKVMRVTGDKKPEAKTTTGSSKSSKSSSKKKTR